MRLEPEPPGEVPPLVRGGQPLAEELGLSGPRLADQVEDDPAAGGSDPGVFVERMEQAAPADQGRALRTFVMCPGSLGLGTEQFEDRRRKGVGLRHRRDHATVIESFPGACVEIL
jgi:hypothetical protein